MIHVTANTSKPELDSQILIVGAGPSGATAAYYLAKAGVSVILIDRQSFPRDKVCGDFVGPVAIKELQNLGVTQREEFKATNIINRAAMYLDGKQLISAPWPSFNGLEQTGRVIPRRLLDSWILKAAKEAGVKVLENVLVTGFNVEKDAIAVTTKNSEGSRVFRAQLLIGADGTNSLIARQIRGAEMPRKNRIIGVRGYYEEVEGNMGEADLHFMSQGFNGYCWLFPTSKTEANVGIGLFLDTMSKETKPKELITELVSKDEGLQKRLKNAKLKEHFEAWPLNTYDSHMPLVANRVLLVGEAAGLVNPINGEGIQYALLSGRWAAETTLWCLGKQDFSLDALSSYSRRVDGELGYGFKVSALIIQLIRNRNLNPLWLRAFEAMITRSKTDPHYANLAGGILSGIVLPSQGLNPNFLLSTLQEATVNSGIKMVGETVQNPSSLPANVIKITQTGIETAVNTLQNPFGFLEWSMETAAKMAELAVAAPSKMLTENLKKPEQLPQPSNGIVIRV